MDFDKEYFNLGVLDTLSYRNTLIHRLDPRTKVISALAFIVTVVSFPKYEIDRLIPFFLLPVIVFTLGNIPVRFVLKKVLFASVFAVFIGLFNPLLDTRTMYHVLGISISGGWVSFFSILLRFILTMSTVLLLISTTSFPGICHALKKLGIPEIFISQLLFLYRYLFVLMEETMRMVRARDLRSFGTKGRGMRVFVSLFGTLFMRTMERAERVYGAMLSRGFTGTIHAGRSNGLKIGDFACLLATAGALILFRTQDLVSLLGRQAERMFLN
jgi:cobalt/nickel transport system permease protein